MIDEEEQIERDYDLLQTADCVWNDVINYPDYPLDIEQARYDRNDYE